MRFLIVSNDHHNVQKSFYTQQIFTDILAGSRNTHTSVKCLFICIILQSNYFTLIEIYIRTKGIVIQKIIESMKLLPFLWQYSNKYHKLLYIFITSTFQYPVSMSILCVNFRCLQPCKEMHGAATRLLGQQYPRK